MKFKVVLFTRPWEPDAAQMVWRLVSAGFEVLIFPEKQERNFCRDWRSLFQLFFRKFFKRACRNPAYLSAEELAIDYPLQIISMPSEKGPEIEPVLEQFKPDAGIFMGERPLSGRILGMPLHGFLNLRIQ